MIKKRQSNISIQSLVQFYCPSLLELNLYIDERTLSQSRHRYIKKHLEECSSCENEYLSLKAFDDRSIEDEIASFIPPKFDEI